MDKYFLTGNLKSDIQLRFIPKIYKEGVIYEKIFEKDFKKAFKKDCEKGFEKTFQEPLKKPSRKLLKKPVKKLTMKVSKKSLKRPPKKPSIKPLKPPKRPLWAPSKDQMKNANMTRFIEFVNRRYGKTSELITICISGWLIVSRISGQPCGTLPISRLPGSTIKWWMT